ncbi:hypothetical protein MKW92_025494 [Papaver armeniacum]|nr:hypothetical protein MKW92_025494 [Papaver armeniacum]
MSRCKLEVEEISLVEVEMSRHMVEEVMVKVGVAMSKRMVTYGGGGDLTGGGGDEYTYGGGGDLTGGGGR